MMKEGILFSDFSPKSTHSSSKNQVIKLTRTELHLGAPTVYDHNTIFFTFLARGNNEVCCHFAAVVLVSLTTVQQEA